MWRGFNSSGFNDPWGWVAEAIAYDPAENLFLWKSGKTNKYYISAILGHQVKFANYWDTHPFTPKFNYALPYFQSTYTDSTLYKNGRWIFQCQGLLGFGTEEYQGESDNWLGDQFYRSLTTTELIGTFEGGGQYHENADIECELVEVSGWESDSFLGEYTAVPGGGQSDTKTVGWKVLTGNNSLGDLTQLSDKKYDKYTYDGNKKLWWNGTDWIISDSVGSASKSAGYWKRNNSDPVGEYNLEYEGDEPPEPDSYTLTFKEYANPGYAKEILIGQVTVCQ